MLKVERIGLHDDFFDLGGHSLMAIKANSQIRDAFEIDLPMEALFSNSTIAAMAKVLSGGERTAESPQRIARREQSGPCALSFAQERLWFLDQLAPGSPVYNVLDAIAFYGKYNPEAMRRTVNELVRRHESLRTSFMNRDGQPMQVAVPTLDVTLAEIDLKSLPEPERKGEWQRIVGEAGRETFDLSRIPLFRLTVVHVTPREHKLLLVMHHIIADEWSMEIMHREATQLYEAFCQGRQSPLPELPIQYADYACWQREWLQGEVLDKQDSYWRQELAGAPTILELPADKPRPAVQSFQGASEFFRLPKSLLPLLKSLGHREQATLFMILEASFAVLLHRYTGQDDILVGTPISGRTHSETQQLIGCFLNTIVLRTRFEQQQTFRTLLRQMRERALGAYAHPDLPFEQLVAELALERDLSRSPLFQVLFVLHDSDGVSQVSKVSGNRELETGTSGSLRRACSRSWLSLVPNPDGGAGSSGTALARFRRRRQSMHRFRAIRKIHDSNCSALLRVLML